MNNLRIIAYSNGPATVVSVVLLIAIRAITFALMMPGMRKIMSVSVARKPNRYNLIAFDPGGTIGWASFVVHFRAFSRPEHRVLRYVESWDCGEFSGTEHEQVKAALTKVATTRYDPDMPYVSKVEVVTEDFDLVQTVGGKELVSPLRINAVLDFELASIGLPLKYQKRQARTGITPERLRAFGFDGRWVTNGRGKDAFAAMQHAVTWLRRLKAESDKRPWKLEDNTKTNAFWDCICCVTPEGKVRTIRRKEHDLIHPK